MTYKSHIAGAGRVFDHLYDPIYTTSASNLRRQNYIALSKSAPLHVCPVFRTMFTELIRERRNYYFPQRNPLPYSSACINDSKFLCDRAINTNNYLSCPKKLHSIPVVQIHVYPEQNTLKTVECQTTYRESSAQTNPWLPDPCVRDSVRKIPEIAIVGELINPITEPNIYEVETIERVRKRRNWEQNLPLISSTNDIPNRLLALESFEYEELMAKEKYFNDTQEERLKIVLKLIKKRQERHHEATTNKLERNHKRITKELEIQKSQLSVVYQRNMRRLKKLTSDEEFLIKEDFVMPKLKRKQGSLMKEYGILNFKSNQNSQKLVKKQNELWEPKGRCLESQHGIREVDNLKNLVEVMEQSRTTKSSSHPECMINRQINDEHDDNLRCIPGNLIYDKFYQDNLLIQKIIKGRSVQNILYSGMEANMALIKDLMESQPIKSVLQLFPERILMRKEAEKLSERLKIEQAQEAADINKNKLKKEQILKKLNHEFSELMSSLDKIITRVTVDKMNKQILQDAEKIRVFRREEAQEKARLAEKSLKLRNEIQLQRDEDQLEIIEGFMEVLIPEIIEKIVDNEAKDYITNIAKIIDIEASKSMDFSNDEHHNRKIILNLLHEFLIPEVSKRIQRQNLKDMQLVCLLAAHDALYNHLDDLPLNDIYNCKIICQDIIEEILKNLPLIA